MKKLVFILMFLLFTYNVYSAPSNQMSISPTATDGTAITASDENSRNNEVSTKFNAHNHTDISQVANTLNVGDAAAGNKTITANNADTNKPHLRYNDTTNTWEVSTDGVTTSMILSGTGISWEGATSDANQTSMILSGPTADRTITIPDASGTMMLFDNPRFKIGTFTRDQSGATGTVAYTGVGFKPNYVLFSGALDSPDVCTYFGFADGTNNSSTSYMVSVDNRLPRTNLCLSFAEEAGVRQDATLSSLDNDGFTLSWTRSGTTSGGSVVIFYIAIR